MDILKIEQVKIVPAVIKGLDFEEAKKNLDIKIDKYIGLTLTEDNVSDMKKSRAELNNLAKDINNLKIKLKKEATEPITAMENEFKSLIGKVEEASRQIDSQVKAWEKEEEDKKRQRISELISQNLDGIVKPSEIDWNLKWLLKGTKESDIVEDIKFQVEHQHTKRNTVKTFIEMANGVLKNNTMVVSDFDRYLKDDLNTINNALNVNFNTLKASEERQARLEAEKAKEVVKEPEKPIEKTSELVANERFTLTIEGGQAVRELAIKMLEKEGFKVCKN